MYISKKLRQFFDVYDSTLKLNRRQMEIHYFIQAVLRAGRAIMRTGIHFQLELVI